MKKTTALFTKEELKHLPFNYQYVVKLEGLPSHAEVASKFNPYRRVPIRALNSSQHLAFYPNKVISKIYEAPRINGNQ